MNPIKIQWNFLASLFGVGPRPRSCTKVVADQTFRVSASGEFEPDGASEALYNECASGMVWLQLGLDIVLLSMSVRYVRIGYPTDTVPGSWQESARNAKLQGVDALKSDSELRIIMSFQKKSSNTDV